MRKSSFCFGTATVAAICALMLATGITFAADLCNTIFPDASSFSHTDYERHVTASYDAIRKHALLLCSMRNMRPDIADSIAQDVSLSLLQNPDLKVEQREAYIHVCCCRALYNVFRSQSRRH